MSTEVVHLRQRTLPSGARSLYLDYTIDGTRTKELLKMYLLPGSDRITKDQNRETMRAARMIQAKRTLDIQNGRAGIATRKGARVLLVDYMEERKAAYEKRGSTYAHTVRSTIRWVKKYKPRVTLGAVDEAFIRGFIAKLGNGVDDGSAYTYYTCLMIILNSAVRDKLIAANPSRFLDVSEKPKGHTSTRAFLTLDEVRDLSEAPCRSTVLKRAFLFSCFCGLRKSDVQSLRWKDLTPGPKGGQLVTVVMQKTQKPIYIPLGANAEKWLPKRGNGDDLVFPGIPPSPTAERMLAAWAKAAGLSKHVTFHVARHTHATLLLTYGADIYTVSAILGHKNVTTTQIYAKIVDQKRIDAINAIPDL